MNVAAILKGKGRAVVTARADATLQDVGKKLAAKNIGALVVIGANGKVEGIISERDIIRAVAQKGAACLEATVSDAMTRSVVSCSESDTLDQLMATMTAGRFRHLPVIENGVPVGIVSTRAALDPKLEEFRVERQRRMQFQKAARLP